MPPGRMLRSQGLSAQTACEHVRYRCDNQETRTGTTRRCHRSVFGHVALLAVESALDLRVVEAGP